MFVFVLSEKLSPWKSQWCCTRAKDGTCYS